MTYIGTFREIDKPVMFNASTLWRHCYAVCAKVCVGWSSSVGWWLVFLSFSPVLLSPVMKLQRMLRECLAWIARTRVKMRAGAVVCTISCHMNDQDDPVVIRDSSPDLILLQMVTILQMWKSPCDAVSATEADKGGNVVGDIVKALRKACRSLRRVFGCYAGISKGLNNSLTSLSISASRFAFASSIFFCSLSSADWTSCWRTMSW